MTRSTSTAPGSLLERYLHMAEAAISARDAIGRDADLEEILEVLATTVALEVLGELGRVPPATREALRRVGARALLQIGTLLTDDDEDRAEAVRLIGPYARDGVRALAGKEPPAPRREDAVVLDGELTGLLAGRFDGVRLAEIAWRVRESREARQALALLRRMQAREEGEASDEGPRLRLAADGGSPMRDPATGRRMAELTVGGHAIELHRFDDGAIAAYCAAPVVLRLGGEEILARVARAGYAEASLGPGATRLDLEVDGVTTTLEIS